MYQRSTPLDVMCTIVSPGASGAFATQPSEPAGPRTFVVGVDFGDDDDVAVGAVVLCAGLPGVAFVELDEQAATVTASVAMTGSATARRTEMSGMRVPLQRVEFAAANATRTRRSRRVARSASSTMRRFLVAVAQ